MAYTKNDWACGDKITADKLNRMEQGIEDAQNGYECTQGWTTLTEETVTTSAGSRYADAEINPTESINADHIRVTIDGTEYECDKREVGSSSIQYGAPYDPDTDVFDFSEYPFGILIDSSECYFNTQTAGTYALKIETVEESITTTPCFEKAVKSVVGDSKFVVGLPNDSNILDKTWQEIYDAMSQGKSVVVRYEGIEGISEYPIINVNSVDTYAVRVIFPPTGIGTNAQIVTFTTTSASGYPKKSGGVN